MLFWIFAIPLILCLAFGIFIRVCVVIDDCRDHKRWDIKDYDERQLFSEKQEKTIAYKVERNIAGEWPECATWITSVILGIVVLIMSIFIIGTYVDVEANIAANKQIYASLVYQYENDIYDNDDDVIGKKQLYDQIQEWNKDLARYKAKEKDFWIGIFYPNVYDQFEFIEYK
jgi:hypothetical protein